LQRGLTYFFKKYVNPECGFAADLQATSDVGLLTPARYSFCALSA